MTDPDRSFSFAGRYLLLLSITALLALVAVGIYSARDAPEVTRGELGPVTTTAPARDSP